MEIIVGNAATLLREKYILTFVDCDLPHYVNTIATTKKYIDGYCYQGYLWDCQRNASNIAESDALKMIRNKNSAIYIMWDIHSCENIFVENYWKYPKEAIIQLEADEFEKYMDTFPEDVYIFDSMFDWTISLTHEFVDNDRVCRYSYLR